MHIYIYINYMCIHSAFKGPALRLDFVERARTTRMILLSIYVLQCAACDGTLKPAKMLKSDLAALRLYFELRLA